MGSLTNNCWIMYISLIDPYKSFKACLGLSASLTFHRALAGRALHRLIPGSQRKADTSDASFRLIRPLQFTALQRCHFLRWQMYYLLRAWKLLWCIFLCRNGLIALLGLSHLCTSSFLPQIYLYLSIYYFPSSVFLPVGDTEMTIRWSFPQGAYNDICDMI